MLSMGPFNHELIVKAAVEGERQFLLQALCLDPFVKSLRVARQLMEDCLEQYLPA